MEKEIKDMMKPDSDFILFDLSKKEKHLEKKSNQYFKRSKDDDEKK